jgi:hypothetical protein
LQGENWSERILGNLKIRLLSSTLVEDFFFSPAGSVVITVGPKNGKVMSRFYAWSLSDGQLVIGRHRRYDRLELVSFGPSKIVVRRQSGEMAEYDITSR